MAKSKFTIVGFSNEKTLVKSFAKELNVTPLLVKEEHYGAGEINLTLPQKTQSTIILITNITEKSDALFRTLLLGDYLRRRGVKKLILLAPWIACAITSLPAPLSPVINTVISVGATC